MSKFNIDKIVVEEVVDYTVNTKDGDEGVGVRMSYLDDVIYDIDGISKTDMKEVRYGILKLLQFIQSHLKNSEIIVKTVKEQPNGVFYTNCPVCEIKIVLGNNWKKDGHKMMCECNYVFKVKKGVLKDEKDTDNM